VSQFIGPTRRKRLPAGRRHGRYVSASMSHETAARPRGTAAACPVRASREGGGIENVSGDGLRGALGEARGPAHIAAATDGLFVGHARRQTGLEAQPRVEHEPGAIGVVEGDRIAGDGEQRGELGTRASRHGRVRTASAPRRESPAGPAS